MAQREEASKKLLFSMSDVFADLINGYVCKGKKVFSKENIIIHKQKFNFYQMHKDGLTYQKREVYMDLFSDETNKETNKRDLVLRIGVENRTSIHEYLPQEIFALDSLGYYEQRYDKEGTLCPVCTIVINYSSSPCTVNSLYDSYPDIDAETLKVLKKYGNDYKINVLSLCDIKDRSELSKYGNGDLRVLFEAVYHDIKHKGSNEDFLKYLASNDDLILFHPMVTACAIKSVTKDDYLVKIIEKYSQKHVGFSYMDVEEGIKISDIIKDVMKENITQ